ncbi:MAG: hypothetical protein AAF581_06905, partial [Planctomycetota bacterium]
WFVVLTIGAGIGLLLSALRHDTNPTVQHPEAPEPAVEVEHDPGPRTAAIEPAIGTDSPSAVTPVSAEVEPAADVDLATVLAAFTPRTYEQGDGVLTGVVEDVTGRPIPDVEVTAVIWGATPGPEPAPIMKTTLEQYVRQEIDQYHYDLAMISRAVTGADGRFEISGIREDGSYRLTGKKEHWMFHASDIRTVKAGDDRVISGVPTAPVTVQVSGPPDLVARGGSVFAARNFENGRLSGWVPGVRWTPETPTVHVPTLAVAQFYGGAQSDVVDLMLEQGEPATLQFTLSAGTRVRGTVHFPDGDPVRLEGSQVTLEPQGATSRPAQGRPAVSTRRASILPGSHSFAFRDVPPGHYHLALQVSNSEVQRVPIDVGTEIREVDLTVPPLERERFAFVRVLDHQARTIDQVTFRRTVRFEDNTRVGTAPGYQDADGTYWVQLVGTDADRSSSHSQEEISLTVRTPRHGEREVPITGVGAAVDVLFEAPAYVTVELAGFDDRRLRHRSKLTTSWSVSWQKDVLGNRDLLRFGPLVPGEAELVYWYVDQYEARPLGSQVINVVSGENQVVYRCPQLHTLRLSFSDKQAQKQVTIQQADASGVATHWEIQVPLNRNGEVLVPWLPGGRFRVATWGARGLQQMVVDVYRDLTVPFQPQELER